jgi:hypothetical protein
MAVLPDGPGVQEAEDMEAYRALDLNHDDQHSLLTNSSLLFTGVLLTHPRIGANLLGPRGSLRESKRKASPFRAGIRAVGLIVTPAVDGSTGVPTSRNAVFDGTTASP